MLNGLLVRRGVAAAAIVGVMLLLGLGTSPAQAGPGPPLGPGWVTYPLPPGVNPALTTQQQIQGQPVGTGCGFSFTGTATPGAPGREQDEVAFNPTSCQAVYAVGPIQHPGPAEGADNSRGSGAANGGTANAGRGDPTLAFYMKTFYEDPAFIDVTSLRNDVEWTYTTGGCNTSYKWKRNATWFTLSGWYLRYVHDSPSLGCNNAISNSDALMENDSFCPTFGDPESVYTHYNYNHEVDGKPNGSVVYSWNDYVDSTLGICYRLLSHHHTQNFETPW